MGRLDIFCSSPAATAICSGTVRSSHRPSDRHVHDHHDHDRFRQKYQHQQPKPSTSRKSDSSSSSAARRTSSAEVHELTGTIRPRPRPRDSDSSRYLLSNNNSISDFVKSKPPPVLVRHHDSPKLIESSLSSCSGHNQVVVLRVSLHCKGCEAKVRKHILKMEGVTSFSIDMETKKVIVKGNVTPSGVLESLSRVKNAQLWPMS